MKTHNAIIPLVCACMLFAGCAALSGKTSGTKKHSRDKQSNAAAKNDSSATAAKKQKQDSTAQKKPDTSLSAASRIMIKACDNYIDVDPQNPKIPEVLTLKASVYYNNKLYGQARNVYTHLLDSFPQSSEAVDGVRMIAQSYYEEANFDMAQTWYRKLKDMAVGTGGQEEATARIAESIFRMAEMLEKQQKFTDAATQYERVALEFPDVQIADVSLFNAGLAYEKSTDWSRAILMFQRLKTRFPASKLVSKSMFRTAKCYEKLAQWDDAAQTYLRLVANYPQSDLTPSSLYNAGFCFENAEKFMEAAATFEKHAMSFPTSKDAADILFKAGELYGQLKDWVGVTRVNQEFSRRYGNDKDRTIQALCMVGVALYMQDKLSEAVGQLNKAVATYATLNNPSPVNKYYAAKAQFTSGEITHEAMKAIKLTQPANVYKKKLKDKLAYLDNTIEAYSKVIKFGISEWTTRSIFQIGQAYEDFAVGIFKQERPANLGLDKSLALELGIAKAVEEYLIDNALGFYEQNVKLGIKEKIENKYIISSKEKLTFLPYTAGENYLSLVTITQKLDQKKNLEDFALIAHKLQTLQKIAPFQERAISLFLKCLEMGVRYQELNEFYTKASSLITKTSYTVAETYGDVANIARGAPIPKDFDQYERYVYKTKLLKQIEGYEENALTNYLKTVKIAQAYTINDEYVEKTKQAIPELLFNRGRCYDLLCITAFQSPPYPAGINEAEKEEYKAQFEELALTYQDQAFEIYKTILDYANQNIAQGDYVNHAYVRLYQNYSDEYGVKKEHIEAKPITASPKWKCTADSLAHWNTLEYNDEGWSTVSKENLPPAVKLSGFPDTVSAGMWCRSNENSPPPAKAFFRRTFYITEPPHEAVLYCSAIDKYTAYINGEKLSKKKTETIPKWNEAQSYKLIGKIRQGKNVLAIDVTNTSKTDYGLFPYLMLTVTTYEYSPQFPQTDTPLDKKVVAEDAWVFPKIKNFSLE